MVMATGNFAELLWPGIAQIWGNSYKMYPTKYTQFMKIKKSEKAFEKEQQITGFPKAAVKEEGNEAFFSAMYQGYQKEFRNLTYSIGAIITREMVEDDQYGQINRIPSMLSESMQKTKETVATNLLNNGFSTNLTPDGVALFHASHPLVGGGTLKNTPTTASDLTLTSLEQGIIDVRNFKDDQGLELDISVKTLVVPNELEFVAKKLLESNYIPGSADNDKNIVQGYGINVVQTSFLTDTDAWFLITDVMDGALTMYERRSAEIDRDNDFDTDNLKIKTTERFSVGQADFRCAYGSPGA